MSSDYYVKIGEERIHFNTGYFAKQADGAVAVSCNETIVLATVVASKTVQEGRDFFPLTVDYREKFYSAGKIPGGFLKREGRPSDREVLTSRLGDRPIRPLFPKDYVNEVQVVIYVLSADNQIQPDVIAINAASAALIISGVPFNGPVGTVRVGKIDDKIIINPTFEEIENSMMDVVVSGTKNGVTMVEGFAKNISEDEIIEAIMIAHENIIKICKTQEEMRDACGKPIMNYSPHVIDNELIEEIEKGYYSDIEGLRNIKDKKDREQAFDSIAERAAEELKDRFPDTINQVKSIVDNFDRDIVRKMILDDGIRADGRRIDEIRPIDIMVGILPRAHGSAVFTRGQTQSLGVVTLGSVADSKKLDALEGETYKRFMLHYNFPNFSVGEVGRIGSVGRREIGHGMLAERSLEYVLPEETEFPYTIRVVSEILESNGSSSMATICSSSLSLFNAGVPLKSSVAGIAMGLVIEGEKRAVLSDILGLEDHLGDMDFKVAGTRDGITGFQMDIKIEGITPEIMKEVLLQARAGRLHILDEMDNVISRPEKNLSPHAPRIVLITVNKDKIGEVIGPGGRVVKDIIEETGAEINIENDGTITVSAVEQKAVDRAVERINAIVEEVEIGKTYNGIIKRVMDYGVFVQILPGKEGLAHVSKLGHEREKKVADLFHEGDNIMVKVIGIDDLGRIDLCKI
ncbi:MAG: polyribonucleotide nucleotidyltransferase [Spirochaetota bacterium]|nr:polyribonucleotide nucleotidyltransferase [Spirochaetota bacterium]